MSTRKRFHALLLALCGFFLSSMAYGVDIETVDPQFLEFLETVSTPALRTAKEPMKAFDGPKENLDPDHSKWLTNPKKLEEAVYFTIEAANFREVVSYVDKHENTNRKRAAIWSFQLSSSTEFGQSIHDCRIRFTGSGDRWYPIKIGEFSDAYDNRLKLDFLDPIWAYLDDSGNYLVVDYEMQCETANGTERMRRRVVLNVSEDDFVQYRRAETDRIFMVPTTDDVIPYRKGEIVRFVWDLDWDRPEYKRYENDPDPNRRLHVDRTLPCRLVIDYYPYAHFMPLLYGYDDPRKREEMIASGVPPEALLEPGKDKVIDITTPKGELALEVTRSAKVHLACKSKNGYTIGGVEYMARQFATIWVYDPNDPNPDEPPLMMPQEQTFAKIAKIIDMDRYLSEPLPVAWNCAEHYRNGRRDDGDYWLRDFQGMVHKKFCAMSVPGYEGFMLMGSFVPDATTAGYHWEGDEAAACASPDTADAHYCAPAVIDALRAKYSYQGGEVGLYAPDTGQIFLYDVNQNPDAAKLAEFRSFLESHMDGGHTVTLWMR